jgi:hypothetical protein
MDVSKKYHGIISYKTHFQLESSWGWRAHQAQGVIVYINKDMTTFDCQIFIKTN